MNWTLVLRLRAIENEYLSCHAALTFALREWANVTEAPEWQGRSRFHAQEAFDRLEATYIIRLFSEFEAILRDFWSIQEAAPVPDRVEDLINRIGSKHKLKVALREDAHRVQYYRNSLVHTAARKAREVTFGDARRALNWFLAELPAATV